MTCQDVWLVAKVCMTLAQVEDGTATLHRHEVVVASSQARMRAIRARYAAE